MSPEAALAYFSFYSKLVRLKGKKGWLGIDQREEFLFQIGTIKRSDVDASSDSFKVSIPNWYD